MDKQQRNRTAAGAVACAVAAMVTAWPFAAQAEDRIVAVVNNDVITDKDLRDFTSFIRVQMSRTAEEQELSRQIETVQHGLLDRMIEDRLMLQDAIAAGIKIDQTRVRQRIKEIRRLYSSTAAFQEDLFRHGLSQADIEKKIREQMILQAIIEKKVRGKVNVKPDEVTQYYSDNLAAFTRGAGREVEVITADSEEVAREAARDIRRGNSLETVGKRYGVSVNSMVAQRGKDLEPEIENRIFTLDEGQVSEPTVIDGRYYVFRVIADVPALERPLPEVQGEIREIIYRQKTKDQMDSWISELKTHAYIKKF